MIARLTDPWFEAEFLGCITPDGRSHRHAHEDGTPLAFGEAQALFLWCPCGFGKPEYPLDGGRPHGVIVPFANGPGGPVPADFGPLSKDKKTRPRWTVSGDSLGNLTCTPSVAVGDPECWHGFITNGEMT
jgi:hypothetical protein